MKRFLLAALLFAGFACASFAQLPAIQLKDINGKAVRTDTLSNGGKPIVISFFATWCKPCRKEMPEMSHWYSKNKKKVELVGIALDSPENVSKFLKETSVSYPIWRYTGNNSRAIMREYGNTVGALPYTVVRAPKCDVQQAILGEVDGAKLDKIVAEVSAKCKK